MNHLDRNDIIDQNTLSQANYLQSLLEAAVAHALLSEAQLQQIQLDLLNFLAKRSRDLNGGDSSLRIEAAEGLLESILYTIGLRLKQAHGPDEAVEFLQKQPVEALYQSGRVILNERLSACRTLYAILLGELSQAHPASYVEAIQEIGLFFQTYSPDFAAHETPLLPDVLCPANARPLVGIEFLGAYLAELHRLLFLEPDQAVIVFS